MISRPPWPLLDDSIGEISSRQSSRVCVGFIAVAVSLLDMQESLFVSSTTLGLRDSLALLDGSPRRRISLRGNHLASVSMESPSLSRYARVSLCLLDDSASLLFSSVTLRLCDSLALLDGSPRRRISLRGNHPASVKVESTTPSISLSPRGFRLSLIQLGDSATL
ncbi:hypothetical protein Bca52824_057636 [Brassica carinata]|uniref:Uncharacterized protein n=1 Tax=Brassica carinata TaxID=52824 RepID=A0A8X7QRX9_BRACI|nr:hypothetical protein Bca52824_057636 [Brassica carinata]